VAPLCVNTLPAIKVTLITDGILFGTLRVNNMVCYIMLCYNTSNCTYEYAVFCEYITVAFSAIVIICATLLALIH
jgi:hypothetical protein